MNLLQIYKKIITFSGVAVLTVMLLSSCSSSPSSSSYSAYTVPEKIDTVLAIPGIEKITFKIPKPSDTLVQSLGVFWNKYNDTLKINFPKSKDTLRFTIHDFEINTVPTRSYTFYFYTYDSAGHKSDRVIKNVTLYGKNYPDNLSLRSLESVTAVADSGKVLLKWGDVPSGSIGTIVKNNSDSIFINNQLKKTQLKNYQLPKDIYNSGIKFRSLYVVGLDTLTTPYKEMQVDRIKIANPGPDFIPGKFDGKRWGNVKYWEENDAVKTRHITDQNGKDAVVGGYDALRGAYMGLERYHSSDKKIENGKIYQNIKLPAGTYQFKAYYNNLKLENGSKGYLIVSEGKSSLPDVQSLNKAIAYNEMEANESDTNLKFTIHDRKYVSLGFVLNLIGDKTYYEVIKVRLSVVAK
jgi:hypothetical protein